MTKYKGVEKLKIINLERVEILSNYSILYCILPIYIFRNLLTFNYISYYIYYYY
ncbi:hypothetical protein Alsa3_CDS0074 [Staphylococcus phage Alsa_3]|nr:hypothetical protein Alsa3_CDS0074 [Staphylococcus phage Alsa_3]WNM51197.1 hypothetical protein Alsa4_CDS0067 [Staphylococcus phage Alsa_4]